MAHSLQAGFLIIEIPEGEKQTCVPMRVQLEFNETKFVIWK